MRAIGEIDKASTLKWLSSKEIKGKYELRNQNEIIASMQFIGECRMKAIGETCNTILQFKQSRLLSRKFLILDYKTRAHIGNIILSFLGKNTIVINGYGKYHFVYFGRSIFPCFLVDTKKRKLLIYSNLILRPIWHITPIDVDICNRDINQEEFEILLLTSFYTFLIGRSYFWS